ncbi:unnamed protein product [Symbiodinium sp. KB8]|nr:unnamed protein product [Symbiodinium sp. KB8]
MTQVNECSGRLISARRTSELRCLHCFPCPDGNHFSRLSMLCRDATFRALQREGHESLIIKLHESPSRCRENIAGVLKHALRLAASQSGAVSPILISVLATSLAEFVSLSSVFTLLPGEDAFSSSYVLLELWQLSRIYMHHDGKPEVQACLNIRSSPHIFETDQCKAAAVFRHQLSQCVPPAYYLTMEGSKPPMQWPFLQSGEYFQAELLFPESAWKRLKSETGISKDMM